MHRFTVRRVVAIALAALVLVSSLVVGPGSAAAASPADSFQGLCTYRVQYGDTLYSIASRYHTTVWNIMSINGLQSFWIYAGSTLRVPCESNDGGGNCTYRAAYVADITIPDHSVLVPGRTFAKVWRVRNTGTCAWGPSYALDSVVNVGGTLLGARPSEPIPTVVLPGGTVDITVYMVAPSQAGRYLSEWKLRVDGSGQLIGVGRDGTVPLYTDFYVGSQSGGETRIRFAPGATSAVVNGRVNNGQPVSYVAWARAGQVMSVRLLGIVPRGNLRIEGVSDGDVYLTSVLGWTSFTGTLRNTEDFRITVEDLNGGSFDYALEVSIR
ncbi:MAG: NBR1-Ig-like domain-containing protein [Rudaea sp.]